MIYREIIKALNSKKNPKNIEGVARYGINSKMTLGIPIPYLRKLARRLNKESKDGQRHEIAQRLWKSGIHEARILGCLRRGLYEHFDKTPCAFGQAVKWAGEKGEFHKRAGFALMACLAWHDKTSPNSKFEKFFSHIKRESIDERNFIKKAVNWSLRQIGKRNQDLKKKAEKVAREILEIDSKSAKWIARDVLRELSLH